MDEFEVLYHDCGKLLDCGLWRVQIELELGKCNGRFVDKVGSFEAGLSVLIGLL